MGLRAAQKWVLSSARMLAAAISTSADPAGGPKASSEETKQTVATMVDRAIVDSCLDNVYWLLSGLSRSRRFIDHLLLHRGYILRLLVKRLR